MRYRRPYGHYCPEMTFDELSQLQIEDISTDNVFVFVGGFRAILL